MEIATEYAKEREQFGRPIGSFQAIKHHCADMLVRFEAARTAVMYAAWAWDADTDDRVLAAAAAKAAAGDAYWDNARWCIQVLGGIGFTTEHPAQLHFKRATTAAQLFGSAASHRELIATQLAGSMAVPA
jgi:alkylation response protein AidB-like acyl-CoA dehydrogenase